MNETLEAMARAIFKDWFVDFGPTRAKMEGRAPYLAPEIWALFPDRLDDEGKPEGWADRRTRSSIADFTDGAIANQARYFATSDISMIYRVLAANRHASTTAKLRTRTVRAATKVQLGDYAICTDVDVDIPVDGHLHGIAAVMRMQLIQHVLQSSRTNSVAKCVHVYCYRQIAHFQQRLRSEV